MLGIGLEAYWPQFEGLRERIEGYQRRVEERVAELGAEVVSAPASWTPRRGAREAGDRFARRAGRRRALPRRHLRDLEPGAAGRPGRRACRSCCSACSRRRRSTTRTPTPASGWPTAPPAACRRSRARSRARGIPYDTVAGTIDDDERAWAKIAAWVRAAGVARALRRSRIGFLGHTYPGMLDMYSDFTAVHAQLGAHVEVLEIDDLGARVAAATDEEVAAKQAEIRDDVRASPTRPRTRSRGRSTDEQLDWSARVAVGLDRLVADFDLDALTYYYRGVDGNEAERLGAGVIVGNSLLTARGIPTAGEGDLKTNIAQLILDRLGAGGSYTEYYALDFDEDFVLMGHDGPVHVAIAEGRPTLRALKLYHGKRGAGLSVEAEGPLRAGHDRRLHADRRRAAEAARRRGRVDPGRDVPDRQHQPPPALRAAAGRVLRGAGAREGPTHHVALGVGHVAAEVRQGRPRCSASRRAGRLMERVCFLLRVRPERLDEYRARHREVWPEMLDALRETGWTNYSLFLRDDGLLVGYLETESFERAARRWRSATSTRAGRRRWRSSSSSAASGRHGSSAWRRSSTLPRPRPPTPPSTSGPRAAASCSGASTASRVELEVVHRFANRPVRLPDGLRWNLLRAVRRDAATGLAEAARRAPLDGVGVDSWGVDYALLDGERPRARAAVPLPRRAHGRDGRARRTRVSTAASCTPSPASRRCRSTRSSSCSPTTARPRWPPPSGSRWSPTSSPCG